ncbi:MAG TPA: hypothetical protein VHE37_12020 [Nevskiaceae bacterium]|nr:hypothetical protein [Nevskiaceae bacterium]
MTRYRQDHLAVLRSRITHLVRQATGESEQIATRVADQVIESVQHEFGGQVLYFRQRARYSIAAIISEIEQGAKRKDICRRHRISTATYYRILHQRRQAVAS